MTIPASMPAKIHYTGDGVTVNFPVPFRYFANSDGTKQIKVILADANGNNEVIQVENTDFTITAAGANNGTLTMNTPPPANHKLTIAYDIPIEQLVDWEEFGRLPSESIEAAFDKVTAILKELFEYISRCIKTPISAEGDPNQIFLDFLDDVAEIIQTAQTAKETAVAAASSASSSAAAALSYAENVKFGMKREAITVNDWTVSSGRYTIFFADVGIIAGVYMADGANFKQIQNIDVTVSDAGITITSLAPFAGYVLLVESVNNQYTYTQNNASDHWVIEHDMGKYPTVQCLNTNNVVMVGTITHDNLNKLHIDFIEPVSGKAILN